MGVITTRVPAALLPEAITQSGDSRMGCVWLPAVGACRMAYLRGLCSVTVYIIVPGCHGQGWGEDVWPVQPRWFRVVASGRRLKTTDEGSSFFGYQK